MTADGGPGTNDPTRFSTQNLNLENLVTLAYGIEHYQLSGPDWLSQERFDIVAKVPEGATREQLWLMLRNLLEERFKLAAHHEQKEIQTYELTAGKNGPKLRESRDKPEPDAAGPRASSGPSLDADGFPVLPGRGSGMAATNGRARRRFVRASMEDLARALSGQLGRPVTDATGLKGKYDFTLSWVMQPLRANGDDAGNTGPDLIGAVQEQLGLRLEAKKGTVDMLVIDHIEKVPTEN